MPSSLPPLTDKQIKAKFEAMSAPILLTPKIFPFNALPPKLENYPGLFKYFPEGVEPPVEKTHGWVFWRDDPADKMRGGNGCRDFNWTYNFWGFYGYRPDSKTSNSDDEFNVLIDALLAEINRTPLLMIHNGTIDVVTTHTGLKIPKIHILRCGQERLHWAPGQITVSFAT